MISRRRHAFHWIAIPVLLISTLPSMNSLHAQSSESEIGRFVAADTFMFLSFNMESIMRQVDLDDELVRMYRTRETRQSTDFGETLRIVFALSSHLDDGETSEFQMPATFHYHFDESMDQQEFIKSVSGGFVEYQPDSYGDYELHHGAWSQNEFQVMGSLPSIFFPSESAAIVGDTLMVHDMIDGEDADSAGKELMDQLDFEAEVHVILEDGSKLVALPMFQFMASGMAIPGIDFSELLNELNRLEIVIDSSQMTPVEISIEMSSSEAAEELDTLLRQGLEAVPSLIESAASASDLDWEDEEIQPVTDSIKGLLQLGKTAAEELELSRDGNRLEIQLANIDGFDRLPHWAFTFIAHRQMMQEQQLEEFGIDRAIDGIDIREVDRRR